MSARFSKEDRELAAMIPALCASNEAVGYVLARKELGVHHASDASILADLAFDHVYVELDGTRWPTAELFAETEALIRDGWTP